MPRSVGTIGLWLFLAALAMLFGSSMVGYIMIRVAGSQNFTHTHGVVHVPGLFWLSTLMVLGVSFALQTGVAAIRRERHQSLRVWLWISLALAIGFIVVQTPAMIILLHDHAIARNHGLHIYGLIFFMVLLHALHVVGGVIALLRVMIQAAHGQYDHEHFLPVHHAAMYWHFLDIVWLIMFATFLLVG
jgi:heme/copper-type cytochrome/quinol oxidase subunit 3